VLAFYRSRWGDLRQKQGQGDRSFQVTLAWDGEKLVPAGGTTSDEAQFSGVLILISEMEEITPERRGELQIPEGGKACMLLINNARKFKGQ